MAYTSEEVFEKVQERPWSTLWASMTRKSLRKPRWSATWVPNRSTFWTSSSSWKKPSTSRFPAKNFRPKTS